ncbi:hypothetical protein [Vibrio harveyi]|uniref:hypothetical protein n=1 Tax=Vibrio harveyi TaxID=669 RepID=UPI0023809194|nr:hypothetical protein [Vibrio harveyi]
MKRLVVLWGGGVAMMSTFAIADILPRKVFECSVNQTIPSDFKMQDSERCH